MINSSFVIYVLCVCASLYIWKKYEGRKFFWLSVLGLIALCLYVWNYIIVNLSNLPQNIYLINYYSVTVLRVILVLAVIFVVFKKDLKLKK
jgi:hypothetical protein